MATDLHLLGSSPAQPLERPCYLEAQRPTTVGRYQSYDFEVQVETPLLPAGATNWTMLRRARAS